MCKFSIKTPFSSSEQRDNTLTNDNLIYIATPLKGQDFSLCICLQKSPQSLLLSMTSINFVNSFGTKAVESTLHQNRCTFTPHKKEEEFTFHLNNFAFVCAGKISKHGA